MRGELEENVVHVYPSANTCLSKFIITKKKGKIILRTQKQSKPVHFPPFLWFCRVPSRASFHSVVLEAAAPLFHHNFLLSLRFLQLPNCLDSTPIGSTATNQCRMPCTSWTFKLVDAIISPIGREGLTADFRLPLPVLSHHIGLPKCINARTSDFWGRLTQFNGNSVHYLNVTIYSIACSCIVGW